MDHSSQALIVDDPTSSFIHMIIDRLQNLENAVEKLHEANVHRNSDLFLTPQSNYTSFNDGYKLLWTLFGEVRMSTNKADGHHLIPIDDEHLDAIVLERGAVIVLPTYLSEVSFIGHPCRHLSVRDLITEVELHIIDERRRGCVFTYREHLAKKDEAMYPWGLDPDDEFRGLKAFTDPVLRRFTLTI